MTIVLFFIAHWYLSLFVQTFYLHRYSAHRMFTMSPFWEKAFHVLTWIAQGSSYLNPAVYGMMHRAHHVYADTEQDPHSPKYDENPFKMMWKTAGHYNGLLYGTEQPEARFTRDLPHWKTMEKIGESWISRLAWGLLYTAFYIAFPGAFCVAHGRASTGSDRFAWDRRSGTAVRHAVGYGSINERRRAAATQR